ncbi:hypothetical protein IWQ57_005020 [Coemansia nantahalensis]|uniref:Uncharacterized protein n=1 Tax=Coemansia nantahalensis TaxID=2789366 RepID=A0ACC1JPW8_9FUNG|nr:hypothetical protein IWQ57_005020 [Coemansia nantahalensis]
MPRVTRGRTKYHAPATEGRQAAGGAAAQPTADPAFFASLGSAPRDIASAPVPLNSTAEAERQGSKKAKRAARHKKWIDKLDAAQAAQRQQRKQQARAADKSALIRGMAGMQQSLRQVQAEMLAKDLLALERPAAAAAAAGKPSKHNTVVSRKARNKAARAEEKRFGQVLRHPAFSADPLATIREHLANTLGTDKAAK